MLNLMMLCATLCVSLSPRITSEFAITLDGKVDPVEWKNATTHALHQEGEVKIMTDAQYVYVALVGNQLGWSHVYTKHDNTIEVLHASAALGFSRYVMDAHNNWIAAQSFNWELRDTTMSEAAINGRRAYLKKNGWVGTVVFMHPSRREQEYIISRSLFDSTAMRIAVLRASRPEAPQYWPHTLNDSTRALELVRGVTIDTLRFAPEQWATIP